MPKPDDPGSQGKAHKPDDAGRHGKGHEQREANRIDLDPEQVGMAQAALAKYVADHPEAQEEAQEVIECLNSGKTTLHGGQMDVVRSAVEAGGDPNVQSLLDVLATKKRHGKDET